MCTLELTRLITVPMDGGGWSKQRTSPRSSGEAMIREFRLQGAPRKDRKS